MLAVTLLYRVATSMGPLSILIVVTERASLPVASIALTSWTLAGALAQPLWVATALRFGHARTLLSLGALTAGSHVAVGLSPGTPAIVAAATIAGLTLPPITAQARALLADLLDAEAREKAFHAESALASSAFVVAPLIVGGTHALAGIGPLVASAAVLTVVSVVYAHIGRGTVATGERAAGQAEGKRTPRSFSIWILVFSGATCYGMLACIEVVAVARFLDASTAAVVLSAWSGASLLGGMAMARWNGSGRFRVLVLSIPLLAYLLLALFGMRSEWFFATVLVVSGIAVAPTLALITSRLAQVAEPAIRPKAYAWLQSGSWIGASIATTMAGVVGAVHPSGVLVIAAVLASTVLAGLFATHRGRPAL